MILLILLWGKAFFAKSFPMEPTLLSNIQGILRRYKGRFIKAFFMVLFSNMLLILNPLIFRHAISVFNLPGESTISAMLPWAALLLTIAMISAYFKYWMRMEFIAISRDEEKVVRAKLFERVQAQSQAFFDNHGIGELLSRLTNDIQAYRDLIGPGIMYPLFFLTLVIPGFIALFSISAKLTVISLLPLLAMPLLNITIHKRVFQLSQAVQKYLGYMSNMTQEHYAGIRIVKSYAIENTLWKLFDKLCLVFSKLSIRLAFLQGLLFPLLVLITRVVTILLVLVTGYIILLAWGELSPADFISFMWIQSYIFFPVLMLAWVLPIYERGRAAYERLYEIYQEPIEVKGNPESNLQIPQQADITFKDLTFSYPKASKPVIEGLNLHIPGGSFVGITGPVGSGKSTLFRLLNREYEIPRGMLYIGGHEIHDYSLSAFRVEMVMVEQIAFLFSKSLAENVRFGKAEASQEELETVAQYADLHDTVMSFPEQYDTVVGERGVTLSGGQKQRIAMARAFLVNRSILLLDDIFSAVDTETEKKIFKSIKTHFQGKTVLLITHRVSILEQMDRVIYLKNGQICEDGTPAELLEREGLYAALSELQHATAK